MEHDSLKQPSPYREIESITTNGTGEKKLVPKTPEAETTHQEFLKRCAVDLKKLERERIFRWVDEFLQPRYSPHDHCMYFKNVLEVTWRNFWRTPKEE